MRTIIAAVSVVLLFFAHFSYAAEDLSPAQSPAQQDIATISLGYDGSYLNYRETAGSQSRAVFDKDTGWLRDRGQDAI